MGMLTKLTTLNMESCGIRGYIPAEIGASLKNLTFLNLQANRLSGPFPDIVAQLPNLEDVYIGENQFTGPISRDQWALLGKVDRYRIDRNKFTGMLPDDIGELLSDKTKDFNVKANRFSGTIPASLALLTGLEIIDLSYNSFTGTVPENLKAAYLLGLEGNSFTGTVPDSVCAAITQENGEIFYDCEGQLTCSCDCSCGGSFF